MNETEMDMQADLKSGRSNKSPDILETALMLFSERGYNGVGVQEIADTAGVTKPALYYFFKNKQGIYSRLWETYYVPFYEKLKEFAVYDPHPNEYDKDMFPQLCRIGELYYSFADENKVFFRLMLSMQFAPENIAGLDEVRNLYRRQFTVMEGFFDAASESHGGMKGKAALFSRLFITDIYAGIEAQISCEKIVKIFLHGMFNV